MKRRRVGAAVLAALFALAAAGCAQSERASDGPPRVLAPATETASSQHLIVTIALDQPKRMREATERLEIQHPIKLVAEWPLSAIDVHCLVFRVAADSDVEALARALSRTEGVQSVQPMQQFGLLGAGYRDEHFELQTALVAINAVKAHRLSTGAEVSVAVVDTGVDVNHPDLAGQVVLSRDFVGDDAHLPSQESHGTAVAGVIAAEAANGKGIVGVAPDARLLALRGCWQQSGAGRCSSFSLARAINFAIAQEVDVLNLSLAGPHDPLLAELIATALRRGVVVVAAGGRSVLGDFPASLEGVIAVESSEESDVWSDSAPQRLPAPGVDIITTAPGGGYDFYSGSSVAAAHVSGVAALLLQHEPSLTPAQLQLALIRGVTQDHTDQQGPLLDSCRALIAVDGRALAGQC